MTPRMFTATMHHPINLTFSHDPIHTTAPSLVTPPSESSSSDESFSDTRLARRWKVPFYVGYAVHSESLVRPFRQVVITDCDTDCDKFHGLVHELKDSPEPESVD